MSRGSDEATERRSHEGEEGSGLRVEEDGGGVRVWVKAVPGASRDEIAGVLGERLKIRVSAPPEGGKANQAICTLLAGTLGVKRAQVSVETGHGGAEKVLRIQGISPAETRRRLI